MRRTPRPPSADDLPGRLITPPVVAEAIAAMAEDLLRRLRPDEPLALIGIETGGVWVADRLAAHLPAGIDRGALDIGFYRDDFGERGLRLQEKPSSMPLTLEDHCVILVDDVIHTGRSARAAINALFDLGRPDRVLLAALVDRGGRELPLQADVVGFSLALPESGYVQIEGPEPLQLRVQGEAQA